MLRLKVSSLMLVAGAGMDAMLARPTPAAHGPSGSRVRGAVCRPLRSVGGDAFRSAKQAALFVAQGSLETITQDVQPGAVLVGGNAIGHSKGLR